MWSRYLSLQDKDDSTDALEAKDRIIKAWKKKNPGKDPNGTVKQRRAVTEEDILEVFDHAFEDNDDVEVGKLEETVVDNDLDDNCTPYPNVFLPSTYIINRRSTPTSTPYIVSDSGTEMTTPGAGWKIIQSEDLPSINIGGPSSNMGQICMHKGTGVTKVKTADGSYILLRASNNALIYPTSIRDHEKETLLCLSQISSFGFTVDCQE